MTRAADSRDVRWRITGVPAAVSAQRRLALGTTFHAPDLFWYAAGVAPILGLHWLARRAS